MIRFIFVGLLMIWAYWVGRHAERQEWLHRGIAKSPAIPPCPYCGALTGYQLIRVDRIEIYGICRTCLRAVDRVKLRRPQPKNRRRHA